VIRVLLADDHQLVRAGLASLLDAEDDIAVVATARDGGEAVRLAVREQPDVVLMDLSMPGMSGEEATAQICARVPSTAVVVLTSFSDQDRIRDALGAGAVGYLLKDTEPIDLVRGVRAASRGESPLDTRVARTLLSSPVLRPATVELTEREEQVLGLVVRGLANKQIGRELGITERTVKAHLTSAFQRIGVTDRVQAALWYRGQQTLRDGN
jgi:DNA-binding NarL/FixJ family response regulator